MTLEEIGITKEELASIRHHESTAPVVVVKLLDHIDQQDAKLAEQAREIAHYEELFEQHIGQGEAVARQAREIESLHETLKRVTLAYTEREAELETLRTALDEARELITRYVHPAK